MISRKGMGDFICELPAIRELHLRGYEHITLYAPFEFVPLISEIGYITPIPYQGGMIISVGNVINRLHMLDHPEEYTIYMRHVGIHGEKAFEHLYPQIPWYSYDKREFNDAPPIPQSGLSRIRRLSYMYGMSLTDPQPKIDFKRSPVCLKEKTVGIAFGSHLRTDRQLKWEFCDRLITELCKKYPTILFHDGPLAFAMRPNFLNLSDTLDLSQLCSYVEHLSCVITPDCGILHLAMCLNIPTIVWFGPSPKAAVIDPSCYHLLTDLTKIKKQHESQLLDHVLKAVDELQGA